MASGLGPSFLIFILSLIQLRVYHSPSYGYVREFYLREKLQSKARAVESTRIISRKRLSYWLKTQAEKRDAAMRLYNLAGRTKEWQAQLWVKDTAEKFPPNPPSLPPSLSKITSTSIRLSWLENEIFEHNLRVTDAPVIGFKIQYQVNKEKSMFGNWESICVGNPSRPFYVIKKLQPNTSYIFRFAMINHIGIGQNSPTSDEIYTLSTAAEEAIVNTLRVRVNERYESERKDNMPDRLSITSLKGGNSSERLSLKGGVNVSNLSSLSSTSHKSHLSGTSHKSHLSSNSIKAENVLSTPGSKESEIPYDINKDLPQVDVGDLDLCDFQSSYDKGIYLFR